MPPLAGLAVKGALAGYKYFVPNGTESRRKKDNKRSTANNELSAIRFVLRIIRNRNVASPQSKLSQLVLQRLPVHVEDLRRARDVAVGLLETA